MGEWSRARDAIHDATTREARDAAMDELWRLARQDYADNIGGVIEGVRMTLPGPSTGYHILLDWLKREFNLLVEEPPA